MREPGPYRWPGPSISPETGESTVQRPQHLVLHFGYADVKELKQDPGLLYPRHGCYVVITGSRCNSRGGPG